MNRTPQPTGVSFSVIIPVHNRAEVVERTLRSVASQTYSQFELILVDNASTDHSLQVLEDFASGHSSMHITVAVEPKPGACAARNRGLAMASGEWVAFFDSDDVMHPTLLESYAQCISACQGNADIVMAGGRIIAPDGHVERQMPLFTTDCIGHQLLHSMLSTQCYAVRRSTIEAVGGWDEALPRWQDYELGARLLLGGARITAVPEVLIDVMMSGEASITGTSFSRQHEQLEHVLDLVTRHIDTSQATNKRRLKRLVDFRRLSLAATYDSEGNRDLAASLLSKAMAGLKPNRAMHRVLMWLYRRIASGKRGSARVAHLLIR